MVQRWLWIFGLWLGLGVGAAAVEVTLYPQFAEVRTPVRLEKGVFVWQPGERLQKNRVEDLVWLSGVPVHRRVWRKGALWFFADGSVATLHYLTRGLSGSVRYRLNLDQGTIEGWLRVKNGLDETIAAESLEFVSGSVPIEGSPSVPMVAEVRALSAKAMPAAKEAFVGAQGGVFRYRLEGPVLLEPEVTELPLFTAKVDPVFYWRYRGAFVRGDRLFFERGYRFVTNHPLAAGSVDLFRQGIFLGRLRIPDRFRGERVELGLGPATRARTKRAIEVLTETRELKRYRVTTTVKNPGEEPVQVEIEERFAADAIEISIEGGERIPRGYRIAFPLLPGGERTYRYTVTLRYKKRP